MYDLKNRVFYAKHPEAMLHPKEYARNFRGGNQAEFFEEVAEGLFDGCSYDEYPCPKIFHALNNDVITGRKRIRSMSVGDVVTTQTGESFVCDHVGWIAL
jgi:hypothetical protein